MAQYNLGVAYFNGGGTPQDYLQAYKWMKLASAQGNEHAKKSISIVEQQMTAEQIDEAQKLSREFVPQQPKELNPFILRNNVVNPQH